MTLLPTTVLQPLAVRGYRSSVLSAGERKEWVSRVSPLLMMFGAY
jgi:hypothetical protein